MVSLPECYTPRKLRPTHPQGANTSGDKAEEGSGAAASLRRPPPPPRRCRGRPRNDSRRSDPCRRIPDTRSAPRASPRRGPRRRASGCPLGPSSPSTRRSVLYAPGTSPSPSWPAVGVGSPGLYMPRRPPGWPLHIRRPVAVLAQSDLEEHQEQSPPEPDRYQGDGQRLPDDSGDQNAAERAGDDQRGGRSKGQRP
jgi:hypothetical protein